jgi:hypothetical protein
MRDTNSYAEFILGLFAALLNDCAVQYPELAKEFKRDLTRLSSAVECHGIRFALDVMPSWRKHLDLCLAKGRLTPSHLPHFGSWKKGVVIPRLFRGLTTRVFDLNGVLKPTPDLQAIRYLRQLLGVVRKFRLACGPKACSDAVREFVRVDLETEEGDLDWSSPFSTDHTDSRRYSFTDMSAKVERSVQGSFPWLKVSQLNYRHAQCIQLIADRISACLGPFDPLAVRLRHGPGAVSDQHFGVHKYAFRNWPDRLDSVFPKADFAVANYDQWLDSALYNEDPRISRNEIPAKLIAVPKTLTTPRLIASEPVALQWCQQGIRDFMYTQVSRSPFSVFVDFRRQELNGQLALKASRSGSHATIDLSSASDRISCKHVERLFRASPTLLEALRATRSNHLKQDICRYSPNLLRLRKYSTMGNATTFPVQSLFFLAVVLGTLHYVRDKQISTASIRSAGREGVRVFGDDLIVPGDCSQGTIDALHALGLRVNEHKTFRTGLFRESCGVDAYAGQDVSTVSVMEAPKRAKPGTVVSSVDVSNNLLREGYYFAATYIRKTVERLGVTLPVVKHGSGFFGWYHNYMCENPSLRVRFNRNLQIVETWCHRLKTKTLTQPAEEGAALLQFFTEAGKVVTSSTSSLHYHKQRVRVSLSPGWVWVGTTVAR